MESIYCKYFNISRYLTDAARKVTFINIYFNAQLYKHIYMYVFYIIDHDIIIIFFRATNFLTNLFFTKIK